MTDDIIHKTCSKCKANLPLSEFNKDKSKRDGLRSSCKACKKSNNRAYYAANREKCLGQQKAHYAANRGKRLEDMKAYYEANREKRQEDMRAYQKANPEVYSAAQHRRRAKKKENGGTLTAEQIKKIQANAKDCFWCGTDCAQDFHLDHIVPVSKGGRNSRCNIAVSCPTCNLQKGAKDLSEWLREIGWRR